MTIPEPFGHQSFTENGGEMGMLDGFTLVRFAHAFESGGGMERLLEDLDRTLLRRNAMTIVRMHIAPDRERLEETEESVGKGRLLRVPLPLPEGDHLQIASDDEARGRTLKERFRDSVLYHPLVWGGGLRRRIIERPLSRRPGQVVGAGDKLRELLSRFEIDLVMLHFFGAADADEIVTVCRDRGIPFCLQNHYANERFLHLSIRKHAELATAVSGVNGLDVPAYLQHRFTNLSDGIDTELFHPGNAAVRADVPKDPVILLPARVVRPKGHWDLVQAAAAMKNSGLRFTIAFAGRIDSDRFVGELRAEIARLDLQDQVRFLGGLPPAELRNWYAAAAVVAFPTYHHEGLGRVVVEAQAMETPVVAYATGGVPEGIRDGKTGFLVETGDVGGLARCLGQLLGDPEASKAMGRAGRKAVEQRFSLDAAAARHEVFYLKASGASRDSN